MLAPLPPSEVAHAEAEAVEAAVRKAVLADMAVRLEAAYIQDMRYCLDWNSRLRRVGDVCYWLSLLLAATSSVFAYLAGIVMGRWWAFSAGIAATLALATATAGRYCSSQSRVRTARLNTLLGRFGVPAYPDVEAGMMPLGAETMALLGGTMMMHSAAAARMQSGG